VTFVGRRREAERLADRLAGLASGRGATVLVSGEPGVGKSSLLRELRRWATDAGATVLAASCFEGEAQAPYALWAELVRARVLQVGEQALVSELGRAAPVVAPLAGLTVLGDGGATAALLPDDARRGLFEAVVSWLRAVAGAAPIVLSLDDLQWADADSLTLLRRVARVAADAPLLVVGAHRSGHDVLADVLPHLVREADAELVGLTGLTGGEAADYLRAEAGAPVPPALATALHAETRGNPFFLRELLRHLIEEGKLARQADRWTTSAAPARLGIPESVRQVVRHRAARLSPGARRAMAVASVFTSRVDASVVAALAEQRERDVRESLDEAAAAGLLDARTGPRPGYEFSHAVVRQALYEDLAAGERRELHRRAASALQAADAAPAEAAELAAQLYQAGAPEGVEHCLAAADAARAGHAHHQAVRFLTMAAELAPAPGLGPRHTARLAIAEAEALELTAAAAHAAEALDELDGAGEDEVAAFVVTVARLLKESGAPPPAWAPLVDRALARVGDRRDLAWARLRLLVTPMEPMDEGALHVGHWRGHDPVACDLARRLGDEEDEGRTIEAWDWRRPAAVEDLIDRARGWRSPAAVLRVYEAANRMLLFSHGDLRGAEHVVTDLLHQGVRWGSAAAQGEALSQLALCHAFMGRADEAAAELAQAGAIIEPLGALHRQHVAVEVTHPIVVGYLGVPVDWATLAGRAAALVEEPRISRVAPLGLVIAGLATLAYAMAGDEGRVASLADPLTRLLERSDPRDYCVGSSVWLVTAASWHAGRPALLARHRALVERSAAAGLAAGPFTTWALPRARLAVMLGDAGEARAHYRAACDDLAAAGHRALLARAGAEMAALDGQPDGSLPGLTTREADILGHVAAGRTNAEIAALLFVSVPTVSRHVANLYRKIGVRNRAEATAHYLRAAPN